MKPSHDGYALHTGSDCGPTFGILYLRASDLCIVGIDSDMKKGYNTAIDTSYKLPLGMSKYFLTGTSGSHDAFDIEEIEVFQV